MSCGSETRPNEISLLSLDSAIARVMSRPLLYQSPRTLKSEETLSNVSETLVKEKCNSVNQSTDLDVIIKEGYTGKSKAPNIQICDNRMFRWISQGQNDMAMKKG